MLNTGGIYMIQNLVNYKTYVGRSLNLRKRWIQHKWHLRHNCHHSLSLQRAWNKYGETSFKFTPILIGISDESSLCNAENYYIDSYGSMTSVNGYNLAPSSGTNRGVKYSEESRKKMSASQLGRTLSQEHREKISKTLTGTKFTQERLENRKKVKKNWSKTSEQIENIKNIQRAKGKSEEYEAFGKIQHLRDWAKEYSINHATLSNRVKRGKYSLEDALTMPIKGKTNG